MSVTLLPLCCLAPDGAEPAHHLYAVYNAANEPKGLNFRGEPCPVWDDLPENVREKWRAVAVEGSTNTVEMVFTDAEIDRLSDALMARFNAHAERTRAEIAAERQKMAESVYATAQHYARAMEAARLQDARDSLMRARAKYVPENAARAVDEIDAKLRTIEADLAHLSPPGTESAGASTDPEIPPAPPSDELSS